MLDIGELYHLVQSAKFLDRVEDGDSFQVCVAKMRVGRESVIRTLRFLKNKKAIYVGQREGYHGEKEMCVTRVDEMFKESARTFLRTITAFEEALGADGKAETTRLTKR